MGFEKLEEIVLRDTTHSNESKKLMVTIRCLDVIFAAYMIGVLIFTNSANYYFLGMIVQITCVLLFVAITGCTYLLSQKVNMYLFIFSMLFWMIHTMIIYGWDTDCRLFFIVLLVLTYFADYGNNIKKILFTGFYFVLYILMFIYCRYHTVKFAMDEIAVDFWQNFNIFILFVTVSIVTYYFSKDSQALENKLVDYNKRLVEQANTDSLTSLYNRRKAMEYLNYQVGRKNTEVNFSLCICDIDYFKRVNDQYGHDFGDEVLKVLAKRLKQFEKEGLFVARWGGEEFLIVFPQCNGDDAFVRLSQIQSDIRNMRVEYNEEEVGITMTFGLTEYDSNRELDYTIKEADNKLYLGKEKGRDVIIY